MYVKLALAALTATAAFAYEQPCADDEASFVQTDINVHSGLTEQFLKAGKSFVGKVTFPDLSPGVDIGPIRLNLISSTLGRWREESDASEQTQMVKISAEGNHIKLFDRDTVMDGTMSSAGVIKGTIVHEGDHTGTFELAPDHSGRDFLAKKLRGSRYTTELG
eukprot:gnl/TRDRNA2_/TRDRNA2_130499_c0_seq1.p1 gnl/TRDRNA2_/TRDRNA2_130499_c0~~gnl/TRDRNA2_/TRDRNA2_130499_c0_seq1.p1  ORF type:complete len:163 (-),score=27.54 gnl/TRDRNA2_/TRDRNA2_130499_c0_seq1:97-585(-)